MRKSGIAILALVVLGNLALWALFNQPQSAPDWSGNIRGVSFSPYQVGQNPFDRIYPTPEEIDADLTLLQGKVSSVRSYSSANGLEVIPALAQKHGLRVTAGAWLDRDLKTNEVEIKNLISNALTYRNIDRLMVGNEAILRGDISVPQMVKYLNRVRAATSLPVSTAEPPAIWLQNPELAASVDYIAIHVLPYWEDHPLEGAVEWTYGQYQAVRNAYPGKKVIFGEVGWPSNGNRRNTAEASRVTEAQFVRAFLNMAAEKNLDYFIMEAFDQPWKKSSEGRAGAYWGLYDAERNPKFAMTGPVLENQVWWMEAVVATTLAALPLALFLVYWQNIRWRGRLFFAVLTQAAMSILTWTLFIPVTEDLTVTGMLVWGVLLPAQLALLIVLLINGLEVTEILFVRQMKRYFRPLINAPREAMPKVSIHVAIHNEPPEMVKETLNGLARLDYPDFEVLIIDNNTKDDAVWMPVEAYCRELGPRFRFYHLPKWPGYKAGALNFALKETAPDAAVVAVIDSDYIVSPDWLKASTPYFADPKVGVVQAPQDNREWEGDAFKTMCNWEFNGFFRLGMVQRNERNAIIQHGTMTMIRRSSLDEVGGWAEWCICEDSELGLRLFDKGLDAVYIDHDFGQGLAPDTFQGYKTQRFRWAFGAMQILRGHWSNLVGDSNLTIGQRFHFITGWVPWISDAFHLVFSFLGAFWTAGLVLAPRYFEFPMSAFLIPICGVFAFKLIQPLWLYKAKVQCGQKERWGAALAGMSLTYTIGLAVFQGLILRREKPFVRTPKAEDKPGLIRALLMAWQETQMLVMLWLSILATALYYGSEPEALVWMAMLGVQSIPYAAALAVSLINGLPSEATHPAAARQPAHAGPGLLHTPMAAMEASS